MLFVLITLFCLWIYAFITGLSPSVERAATMFSLLVIGENLKRRINVYNSLAASALLLLIINPNNLFEAGFQLSYSAVFGIVFLQPQLAKTVNVQNKAGRFFWMLFTVSVAAQIATFPITLYYFNQFPTYFWLSNLLVIPAVSLLIPLGLSLLVFGSIPVVAQILTPLINIFIRGIYFILQQIEQLPFSVLYESVNTIELIFIIGMLLSFLLLLKQPRARYIKVGLICVFLFIGTASFLKISRLNKKEIIVYNYPDNTILQLIEGKSNYVISENEIKENDYVTRLLTTTQTHLHLKEAVFLTHSDSISNRHLFYKNGVLLFGKSTLLFNQTPNAIPREMSPDFAINPVISKKSEQNRIKHTLIILNHNYTPRNLSPSVRRYNVNAKGAFRKKW